MVPAPISDDPSSRERSGDHTRSNVINEIRAAGSVSRVELASKVGITAASISVITRALLDEGMIIEVGFSAPTGGKPRTLLALNPRSRCALGVSLGRHLIAIVLSDLGGHPIGSVDLPGANDRHPAEVLRLVWDAIRALIERSGVEIAAVVGIGIAGPGPLDTQTGTIRGSRPSSLWTGFPVEKHLESLSGLPVILDNDATCAALGEYWTDRTGAARAVSATVFMSDGIGCGILVDGRVFHGMTSNAGELGHISLDPDGRACRCGARGCVEVYASPTSVVESALTRRSAAARWGVSGRDDRVLEDFGRICDAAAAGDQDAGAIVAVAARALARAVVILSNILDLDVVRLTGPGFALSRGLYVAEMERALEAGTFMRSVHSVRVHVSAAGSDAAALGAAALILQHRVTPHAASADRRASAAS